MALEQTLIRLQDTLHMNQRELAALLGCSTRTVIRYYHGGGMLTAGTYQRLARAVHPHDRVFAAELAALEGHTLISLGLELPAPPPPPPAPPVAMRPTPSSRHMVDSIVCAAAEAMQTPPHVMRPALTAAFERASALGMTAEEVLKGMAVEPAAKGKA
jgi:transcriptional regulator with XRE-family HTH domain